MRGEAERLFSLEKEEQTQGDLVNMYKYPMGRPKENGGRLFSAILRIRSNGHKLEHRRFCLNIRKLLLWWQLAQIAQRGYGIPLLGDTLKPFEHSPRQPGVEDPALNSEKGGWTGRFPVVLSNARHFGCLKFHSVYQNKVKGAF